MNRNLKTAATLAAMGAAALLSGCAFVPMTVHSHYTPPANVAKVPGADKVVVDVVVKNEKKHKNEVSVTKDGYGIPMAGVYMHVARDFKAAISDGLRAKGFVIGKDDSSTVFIAIKHFYLPEQMHLWSASHTGHGDMLVMVRNASGKVLYNSGVTVKNIYFDKKQDFSNFNLTSAGRHESANILLRRMVDQIVNAPAFIAALMKVGGQP